MALATEDLVTGVLISLLKEGVPVSNLHKHEKLKGKISRATVFRRLPLLREKIAEEDSVVSKRGVAL